MIFVKKSYISHSLAILFLDIIPTLVTLSPIKHQPDHNGNKNTQCHNYPSKKYTTNNIYLLINTAIKYIKI